MQRLIYNPKVWAYIKDKNGKIHDISEYIVSGSVSRKVDQVSTAELQLRNPDKLFTAHYKDGKLIDGAFTPMDPITIYLRRLKDRPVRVFTGFLDASIYIQLYPGTITLRASCTLKRLLYTYFDPALPFTQEFLRQYGWASDAQGNWWSGNALGSAVSKDQLNGGKGKITNTKGLTVSGSQISKYQTTISERILDASYKYSDNSDLTKAILEIGIVVSKLNNKFKNGSKVGVFGITVGTSDSQKNIITNEKAKDINYCVKAAIEGRTDVLTLSNAEEMAAAIAGTNIDAFKNVSKEAQKIIDAYQGQVPVSSTPSKPSSSDQVIASGDGTLSELLFATMKHIGNWDEDSIYIENVPPNVFTRLADIAQEIGSVNDDAIKAIQQLFKDIVGSSSYGSSNGASSSSTSGTGGATGEVKGQDKIVAAMSKIADKFNIPRAFVIAVGLVETDLTGKDDPGNPHYGWFQMQTANPPYAYGRFSKRVPKNPEETHDLGIATSGFCEAVAGWIRKDSSLKNEANWQALAIDVQGIKGYESSNPRYGDKSQWDGFVKQAKRLVSQYGDNAALTPETTLGTISTKVSASASSKSSGNSTRFDAIVAEANRMDKKQIPYTQSSGRDGTIGYDCSSSVSELLIQAGYKAHGYAYATTETLVSTYNLKRGKDSSGRFTIWIKASAGNASHAWAQIDGQAWTTGDGRAGHFKPDYYAKNNPSSKGFVAYHISGLDSPAAIPTGADTKVPGGKGNSSQKIYNPIPAWDGKTISGAWGTNRGDHIHSGVDIGVPVGSDCVAPVDGTIGLCESSGFGQEGGMIHFILGADAGGLKKGDVIGWGHAIPVSGMHTGKDVKGGKVIAKSNYSIAPHVHFIVRNDDKSADGYPDHMDPTPFVKALAKGGTTTGSDPGTTTSISTGGSGAEGVTQDDLLNAAGAGALYGQLSLGSAFYDGTALLLSGDKSLMNDVPLMSFVQQLCKSGLRSFQSLPDGRFYAFFPDYFGEMNQHPPYWEIEDLEVLDGGINLSDDALVTHMYVVGDTAGSISPSGSGFPEGVKYALSNGVMTIFDAFTSDSVLQRDQDRLNNAKSAKANKNSNKVENKMAPDSLRTLMDREQAAQFMDRYGARPKLEDQPLIRNSYYEFFLSYQEFMLSWSKQFSSPFTFTFMPELFPGGKIGFPSHTIQMYVEEVQHSFDYTSGFTTQAVLSAPSVYGNSKNAIVPPNMIAAIIEPAKITHKESNNGN